MQSENTKGQSVDKERLSQILNAAKGQHRTMKQFAEECGVNPSTLSRIHNKKISSPISETVLHAIYEHRDPSSGVAMRDLLQANGRIPSNSVRYDEYRFQSRLAKEIIMKEIMYRVEAPSFLEKRLRLSKSMGYAPDMICEDESFGGNGLWAFDFMPCFNDNFSNSEKVSDDFIVHRRKLVNRRRIFDRISRYATMYYFHPEIVPQRFTFIVANKDLLDDILDEYGEQKFKTDVSLILVDLENGKIVEEYIFQRNDGTMMDKFFSIKAKDSDNSKDDDLFDIDNIHADDTGQTFLF